MIARVLAATAVLLGLILAPALAHAQTAEPKRSPFGVAAPSDTDARGLTSGRDVTGAPASGASAGVLDRAWAWVLEQQRLFRREINAAVTGMKKEPLGPAFFAIVFASFLYGVLHAAGPGHGKGVISSYVLANNQTMRRGILLSFLSATIQALSAISIFAILNLALNARKQDFDTVEAWLATVSWGLVALMGAWLLWRQVRPLVANAADRLSPPPAGPRVQAHGHDHASHGHHDHHHDRGHDRDCGHAHIPAARDLEGPWSWPRALSLAFSIGIRPCTGALAVLALTTLNGLFWAGVAATFAMAAGTAITISVIAALAVGSRNVAARVAGGDGPWASRVATAAGVAGAAALFVLGTAFFFASLRGGGPI